MTAVTFPERVAARTAEIRPARALLSVLAFPFYVLGLAVGVLLAGVLWCWAAAAEGFDTGRGRSGERR